MGVVFWLSLVSQSSTLRRKHSTQGSVAWASCRMQRASLLRLTINIAGLPCHQLYKHADGTLWWDLDYMHAALHEQGAPKRKHRWLEDVKGMLQHVTFLADGTHVHTAHRDASESLSNANVCTSLALLTDFWMAVDVSKKQPIVDACCGYLVAIAAQACHVLPIAEGASVQFPFGHVLTIRRNGAVSGFWALVSATHGSVRLAWVAMWSEMRGLGLLEADVAASDEAIIRDIIFCLDVQTHT